MTMPTLPRSDEKDRTECFVLCDVMLISNSGPGAERAFNELLLPILEVKRLKIANGS
jgi:hypothetical protein